MIYLYTNYYFPLNSRIISPMRNYFVIRIYHSLDAKLRNVLSIEKHFFYPAQISCTFVCQW